MRRGLRWRIHDHPALRARFLTELQETAGPVLLCANHLTLVDSAILAWALAPSWWYVLRFAKLPWNLPERANFAATWRQRALAYGLKCLPVSRGTDRSEVSLVLKKMVWLLSRGDLGLIFPEGGRGRTGRVDVDAAAYGVGRIVNALPGLRVACVYLRGAGQATYTDYPARGEVFHVDFSWLEPKTSSRGLRGSVDVARQILTRIAEMETAYFCQPPGPP